jgi:hypothetical protein
MEFNLIVEKHCLRFYKYRFLGYENKPIVVEAFNKIEARTKLSYFIQQHPEFMSLPVVDESLSLPIYGETTKNINGVENVWVGNESPSGWFPLNDFINNDNNGNNMRV